MSQPTALPLVAEAESVPHRIVEYVHDFATRTPEAVALVTDGHRLTYKMLEEQVVRLARALLAKGVRPGETVAVLSTPRTEFWVTFLATTAIGAVWVGLNPKFTLRECHHVVGDAQPRLLFTIESFEGRDYSAIVAELLADHPYLDEVVCLVGEMEVARPYADFLRLADLCDARDYDTAVQAVGRDDPALLVYTSGSSGAPKGALLSHHSLTFGAWAAARHLDVRQLTTMCSFPINHVSSVADTCCVALVVGGTVHFHERFDPGATLACIEDEGITLWGGVPTMFLMALDHPRIGDTDFSTVELAVCGGAALPESGWRRLRELVPRVMNVYGMTETAANIVSTDRDASLEELSNTIGRPTPQVECRIVGDGGATCDVDEVGELQFRADFMFSGYLSGSAVSRDAYTADGWLRTGDLGFIRPDGNIALVGRKSERFKSGGYNIYPREIEQVLERHPAVAMAAVVPMPDAVYQEVGMAYVVPVSGIENRADELARELRRHCAEHLANYKVPKQFTVSRELPTLAVGKVDKAALRRRMTSETST